MTRHDSLPNPSSRAGQPGWRFLANAVGCITRLLLIWSIGLSAAEVSASSKDATSQDAAAAAAITHWVQELGSPLYARRLRATQEIQRFGVDAFEALHKAQTDPDVEIRKQAEYLLRSIPIAWVATGDSSAVRLVLSDYDSLSADDRLLRIERMRSLEIADVVAVLCRVARFETSELLSKHAALILMQMAEPADATEFQHRIEKILGPSQRTAAVWLTTYAASLEDPMRAWPAWRQLGKREVQLVLDHPDANRQSLLRDFLRWRIDRLNLATEAGSQASAVAELDWVLNEQWLPIQVEAIDPLLAETDWMLQNKIWAAVDLLAVAYPKLFDESAKLRYRLAELMLQRGDVQAANELAGRISASIGESRPDERLELALDLQSRGQVEWAAKQYDLLIEQEPPESYFAILGGNFYGLMCHDYGWNLKAYDAYARLFQQMEEDQSIKQLVQRYSIRPLDIRSRMHFSHALYLGEQGKHDEQRKELKLAIEYDDQMQPNADIAIAMYRVPNSDEAWRTETMERIDAMRRMFEQGIELAEVEFNSGSTVMTQRNLATQLNQFAWLVSNTTGDYQAALRASQRSLNIVGENGGYLDTLARCYYAAGNLDKAITTQRRALDLDHAPGGMYSGQIKLQYEFFLQQAEQLKPRESAK